MVEINTFVRNFSSGDGRKLTEKPTIILVYLFLETFRKDKNVDCKRLLELFFPDKVGEFVKGNKGFAMRPLRQQLSIIRQTVGGREVLSHVSNRCAISFYPEEVKSYVDFDFLKFTHFLEQGEPKKALELYKADFCQFYSRVAESEELQLWIREKQEEFRKEVVEAEVSLAKEYFQEGNFTDAGNMIEKSYVRFGIDDIILFKGNINTFTLCYSLLLVGKNDCSNEFKKDLEELGRTENLPKNFDEAMKFLQGVLGEIPYERKGKLSEVLKKELATKKELDKELETSYWKSNVKLVLLLISLVFFLTYIPTIFLAMWPQFYNDRVVYSGEFTFLRLMRLWFAQNGAIYVFFILTLMYLFALKFLDNKTFYRRNS